MAVVINGSGTVTGLTAQASDIELTDDTKLLVGTGDDLEIYHDASHSYITDGGTGNLKIGGSQVDILGTSETMATFVDDGAVTLYHNNVAKVATTATGVDVTGYLTAQEVNTHWHFVSPTVDMDSAAVVDFSTEITKGSAITESGGRITCTIAGTYLLMAMFNNASDFDDTTNVWFRKNTTRIGGSIYWEGPDAGQDYSSMGGHVIVQLAANDIVDVYGSGRWSGNTNTEAGTYFQGIRIGE